MKLPEDFGNDSFLYKDYLEKEILGNSEAETIEEATEEWDIEDTVIKENTQNKERPQFLYKIVNRKTGAILFPVEASTLRKFRRVDLTKLITIYETLYQINKKEDQNQNVEYTDFNKDTINFLFDETDIFQDNQYNNQNKDNDYEFFMYMFHKEEPSLKQEQKFRAIYNNQIRPYIHKLNLCQKTKILSKEEIKKENNE